MPGTVSPPTMPHHGLAQQRRRDVWSGRTCGVAVPATGSEAGFRLRVAHNWLVPTHWTERSSATMRTKLPDPIDVPWTMKPLASAETAVDRLPDGRIRFSIRHDIVADVTPAMIVWWLKNMNGDVEIGGRVVPRYRAWHPRDHVAVTYVRKATDGSNMGPGSVVRIQEHFQRRPDYAIDIVERVTRLDEGGFTHINFRGGIEVARMEYSFRPVDGGTLYENCLIVGVKVPVVRRVFNRVVRPLVLSDAMGRAWLLHNVEEVGNLQFFLPELYERSHN